MRLLYIIIFLCCALTGSAQYNVERLLLSGRVALHYEDYVLSVQYFNQAIAQKPYLWEPWQLRAISKYYLEDWTGAEYDATKAIELNPYITSLYDLRGIARIRQEKYTDAITDYTKAIAQEPDNQNYWYNRAVCYLQSKNYDTAQVQLDSVITRWKKFASAYFVKAETFLFQKDTTEALAWINKGLSLEAHNVEVWKIKAHIALSKENWTDADDCYSKALHYKPKDVACYINRALARLRLNNLRGAMSDYDTALELAPDNFLAHYNRGLLRQQVGDDNRAIEDFNYVLSLEPGNVMALFNRATLLDRTGDLHGAIRDYTLVINKFPNFWTGLHYRALCYRKLGQIARAEKDEFRILKAQMDKHLGVQQRWSRKKLSEMRKINEIDPEKYNQLVVQDEDEDQHEYKSEYRGKVQNRVVSEQYQPYIALTFNAFNNNSISKYKAFNRDIEDYLLHLQSTAISCHLSLPVLGGVGEGTGVTTFALVDSISSLINKERDENSIHNLLILRSVAYSSAQNYQDALRDIETVLNANPNNIVALWQKAICNAMMMEYELSSAATTTDNALRSAGVIADFDMAASKTKDTAILLYCQGTYCARREDYSKAVELLSEALRLDSQLPQAYYNRGLVYMKTGDTQRAKQDLGKAGELGLYSAYSIMKSRK